MFQSLVFAPTLASRYIMITLPPHSNAAQGPQRRLCSKTPPGVLLLGEKQQLHENLAKALAPASVVPDVLA